MSITVKQNNRLIPLPAGKPGKRGNLVCPPLKKTLMPRSADNFKNKKVRNEDVQLVLKFLRECFDFAPTISPADTVCKLRLKMKGADHKIKRMKDQLVDHDVLLFDVQEELNLGPETNPIRTARAFKTFVRASKERTTRLEKTIKGNETVLKVCKEIAGVSGHLAPDGLADLLNSTWSKQRHVITQLKNNIQKQKEHGPRKDSPVGQLDESILTDLAQIMDVDTKDSQISTVVDRMKITFMDMKDDVIRLKDTVKVKEDTIQELQNQLRNRSKLQPLKPLVKSRDESEIENLRDREKTKTKRIIELQNELEDVKTKNLDLTLDLQEAQDQRQTAENRVFGFESKIRDLEMDIEKKTCEIEDLLQRYEDAGEVVYSLQTELDQTKQNNESLNAEIKDLLQRYEDAGEVVYSLQTELDQTKQNNESLNAEIKTLQSSEFKKDDRILKLEKELANFQQKMESDSKLESGFMAPKIDQSALKRQKIAFDDELKNLRSDGYQRNEYVLKLERDIASMQTEKDELYQQIQNSFSLDYQTSHQDQVLKLKQELESLKEQKIELELKIKDIKSESDVEIFELNETVSEMQEQKIELDSKLKDIGDKYLEARHRIKHLEKDVANSQSKKSQVDSENQRLSKLISENEAEMKQLLAEKEQLKTHFEDVNGRYSDATHRIIQLERDLQSKKIDEVESENQRLSKLISKCENEIKQIGSEKEQLTKHYEGLIDRRFEKLVEAEQHANQKSRDLANAVYQKLASRMKVQLREKLSELNAKNSKAPEQQRREIRVITQSYKNVAKEEETNHREEEVADLQSKVLENQRLSKLISEQEAEIKQRVSEREQLKTHYEGMIDRRFKKLAAAEQHANQKSRDLANAVCQILASRMKNLAKEDETTPSKQIAEESHLVSENQDSKTRHQNLNETVPEGTQKKVEQLEGLVQTLTTERNCLSADLLEAKKEYQNLNESVLEGTQKKVEQLEELVQTLTTERNCLSADLLEAKQDYQVLEDQFESVNEEGEKQQTLAFQISQEKEEISKQLERVLQQCKELEERQEKEKSTDLSAHVMKAQQQYQGLKERFASELEEVTKTRQELIESTSKERDDLRAELEEAYQQYEETHEKMLSFQKIGDDVNEHNYKMSTELGMVRRDYQELDDKFKAAKEESEKQVTQLKELDDKLKTSKDESEKQVTQLQENNDYLLSELTSVRKLYKELDDKFKAARKESEKQVTELQKNNDYLLSELTSVRKLYRELEKRYKAAAEESDKQVNDLQEENDNLLSDLTSLRPLCQEMNDKYKVAREESEKKITKLQEENEYLVSDVESLRPLCQNLQESLQAMTDRNEELSGELEEEITKQQKHDDELYGELENSLQQCQDLEVELERETLEFQEKLAKLENENASLLKQLSESRKSSNQNGKPRGLGSSEKLEKQIVELQKHRKDLEQKLETAETERKDMKEKSARETLDLKAESAKLEKEKANLIKQLEGRQIVCQQFEEYLAAATEENERNMALAAKLKDENDDLSRQLAQGTDQTQQISSPSVIPEKTENPDEQIEELQNRKKELEKKLNKAENECSIMTMKNQTAITKMRELENLLKDAQDKIKKLEIKIMDARSKQVVNPASTNHPKKLEERITELQKERKELKEKLQNAEAECKELKEKEQIALDKVKEIEELKKEVEAKNKKLEFEIKLTKKKVETAFSMTDDYKADIVDMKVHHRGLKNQVDFQKRKNEDLQEQMTKMKERNDLLEGQLADVESEEKEMDTREKETEELKEKESELKEMRDHLIKLIDKVEALEKEKTELESQLKEREDHLMKLIDKVEILEEEQTKQEVAKELEMKLAEAETRENEMENELKAIRTALATAAFQFGLLTKVGDELTIIDLCQSLDDMRQLNTHMRLEINDLEKAKSNLEDTLKTGALNRGDSDKDRSAGEREKFELRETVEDLRFQTYKQENMIKKLRYQVSEFHQYVLKKKNAMFDDMPYIDRAVVMRMFPEAGPKILNADDLSMPLEGQVDDDEREIGKGAFGKVFLRLYQDEAVAVKVPYVSERVKDEDTEKRKMRIKANHARTTMEYVVHLSLAHHPSFPKTIGIVDYDSVPSLVLEFLGEKETGNVFSLSQAIKYPSPSLRRGDWFGIIMDIVDGMKTMHIKGLLHNDLKANNVLLQWDHGDKRWHAFIIDMGKVSTQTIPLRHRHIPEDELEGYKEGTIYQHLAPEYILDRQPMSIQTDIYSVGKILGRIEEKVIKSRTLRDLAAEMTNTNPRLRPSWKHIEKDIAKAQKRCLS